MLTPETRHAIGWMGVGFGLLIGGLGLFIGFYPGAEAGWYGTAAAAAAFGLVSPNWRLRLVALILVAIFTCFAWLGYRHGLEYQQWLREQHFAD